ncbi:tyrosine-protein phosphatase [Thermaurantiacus tibetensis]|uniref:tyrosine-protein phosphatase n=1 Tax=Thermaurantiacus tibetensis TaxID=2759035 RepID=UPI00188E652A|nr:tyrosine-protein phosphatase [Thermaurantiacus tibetensis]
MRVFQGVDRAYLEAAFAAIDARPGGMDRFMAENLGLSAGDIATLRRRDLR